MQHLPDTPGERLIRQTVIVLPTGGGGTFNITAAESFEDVMSLINEARAGGGSVTVTHPVDRSLRTSIPANHVADVLAIFEQNVKLVTDPREAGMQETPSGIRLPFKPPFGV